MMAFDMFSGGNHNFVGGGDTIYYWLFPLRSEDNTLITDENELTNLTSQYLAFLQSYLSEYIWYDEAFTLSVKKDFSHNESSGGISVPHIGGSTSVGDYLEDEWFVVFLLVTLTKNFPSLICRVFDDDGEFLIIEAAPDLPPWACDPRNTEGRVFLREGAVHLVSPAQLPPVENNHHEGPKGVPPTEDFVMTALDHVSQFPYPTLAPFAVQTALSNRIKDYPAKISKVNHTARVYIPVAAAALLREYPTLVSSAVGAFCDRDALDNKCLRVMRHFAPETRVMTNIRFSKASYARLVTHDYTPDLRTGWDMPPATLGAHGGDRGRDWLAHSLGVKLACGFEILVCSVGGLKGPSEDPSHESCPTGDFGGSSPQWLKYKKALEERGYFKGELEGSKLHRELEENAWRFFISNEIACGRNARVNRLSAGDVVVKLLRTVDADFDVFKARESTLAPPDDDSWMDLTPASLDEIIESKFGRIEKSSKKSDREIADSLNLFLSHVSSFEGAEVPPDAPQDNLGSSQRPTIIDNRGKSSSSNRCEDEYSSNRKGSSTSPPSVKVNFDAAVFSDAINNILDFSVPDDNYFDDDQQDSFSSSSDLDSDDDDDFHHDDYEGSHDSGFPPSFLPLRKSGDRKEKNKENRNKGGCEEQEEEEEMEKNKGKNEEQLKNTQRATSGSRRLEEGTQIERGSSSHQLGRASRGPRPPLAAFEEDLLDTSDADGDADGDFDTEDLVAQLKLNSREEGGVGPSSSVLSSLGVNPLMRPRF